MPVARSRPDMLDMDVEAKRFERYMQARREHEKNHPNERFDIDAFVAEVLEKEFPWIERQVRDPWCNDARAKNEWRKRQREKRVQQQAKPLVMVGR